MMGRTDMLAVRGLTKRYPAFVLEDVSFTLRPGRIMGPVSYTHLTLPTIA